MNTKSLLIGIISFIAGGLLVSTAAVTFDKPEPAKTDSKSMASMAESLEGKTGDSFDRAFIAEMIEHHEGAVEMARLSNAQAKHEEIKRLSETIITTQEQEISEMRKWQTMWGYDSSSDMNHPAH